MSIASVGLIARGRRSPNGTDALLLDNNDLKLGEHRTPVQ